LVSRIKRLERPLLGDGEPMGDGVAELRIHIGVGWRVYFTQRVASLLSCWLVDPNAHRGATSSARKRWSPCWTERGNEVERTSQGRRTGGV
jgi:putative component of toxin-antitoxin plasmid stabilization module